MGSIHPKNSTRRAVFPLVLGETETALPYLALGMVVAYLREQQARGGLAGFHIHKLMPAGCLGRPLAALWGPVVSEKSPVCLFSSYVWNHEINLRAARKIKELQPSAVVIFGGPHVPKYETETEQFLRDNEFIDIAIIGEGEETLIEILQALEANEDVTRLAAVNGIVYHSESGALRTKPRERLRNISQLPSPYLSGEFEPWFENFEVTVLETNRGCPYGCTYCDWGSATLSKVSKFTPERVIAEIEYLAQKKSKSIFIADANFGMLEQDIEIARGLVEIKERYGYPQRVMTNFTKNGGRRAMEVIKILHKGGLLPIGIVALQTTDPTVLKVIERDNIKTESFETMMRYFNEENIPMASDLMIGLPGQTIQSFVNDLQYCFNWKVSAAANYTSLMPNAPMAERTYRKKHKISTDETNMIVSSSTFSESDLNYMKKLYITYLFHVKFSVLKYVLLFFQIEHRVEAIPLLRRWLDCATNEDERLPISTRVLNEIFNRSIHRDWAMLVWKENADFLFSDIEAYYHEFIDFACAEFSLDISATERSTLVAAQQAVMPREGRSYPYTIELQHDMESYIKQMQSVASLGMLDSKFTRLNTLGRGKVTVESDTEVIESTHFLEPGTHADAWELPSALRFY